MSQAMKIPEAKKAVDKEWEKLEKILAWNLPKVRNKSDVIDEARNRNLKINFAPLMDICHLKNAELQKKHQKYKGRIVCTARRHCEKTIQTLMQYSQNKDHQHHKCRPPKSWILFQTYLDAQDKQLMQYLPTLKLKWKMLRNYWKFKKSECPDILISPPRHKWPKSWSSMEDPVVPLERNIYGHSLAGLLWERQFEKIQWKNGWEKVSNCEFLFVHREKLLFLSVYVDDIKLAGKKENMDPKWTVIHKEADLGEPTSFLDHVYLGCTQRQCETSKDIVDTHRTMFESRISAGAT